MINLTDAEKKHLTKPKSRMRKALNKLERRNFLNLIKGIYRKPTAKIYSMVMAWKAP